ncbi:hypothetical protein [Mucilaginibacter gotjawali]|uniref:Uncharacterized protein n=2 Tax=Mucilaginibacter gotjawali TaxID=1550579 RepID=A0A839SKI9_9SPHI|nr:hypothetical protein [Mucilaginibacter gotjawali]MBB3057928.1 hypothetical protein [Mucilaginibacter gotjawali]BAU52300.1 hypothetical protein MgSA37_00455 [Mucilaginibacter gotjawali]
MKTYTLDEVQDKLIGKIGMPNLDEFEKELQVDSTQIFTKRETKTTLQKDLFGGRINKMQ